MFNNILDYVKNLSKSQEDKKEEKKVVKVEEEKKTSKDLAKQRLHVLLVQDRASVSSDFIDLMKEEIMEVVSKYVVMKEEEVEMDITTTINNDGQKTDTGILLKIPFENVRNEMKSEIMKQENSIIEEKLEEKKNEVLAKSTPEEVENNSLTTNREELAFDITAEEEELRRLELLKEQFKQREKENLAKSSDEFLLETKTDNVKKTINEIEKNTKKEYTKVIEVETESGSSEELFSEIDQVIDKK